MTTLTETDKKQLKQKGIKETQVAEQIEIFKKGIPFVNLIAAATINHGIHKFSEKEKQESLEN